MTSEKQRQNWSKMAAKALEGRTIIKARYPTAKEVEVLELPGCSVLIELDNGAIWTPFSDDEGNAPGAFALIALDTVENDIREYPHLLPTL